MRERLIKLIKHCTSCEECRDEDIADHLLAHGVIVLPCKVVDTVYGIAQPCGGCKAFNEVMTEEYLKMCQKCDRFEIIEVKFDYELIPEWGKTVFLTKEQAEKALAERSDR